MMCGSHSQSIVPRLDLLAVLDHHLGAVGDVVLLELAALGVEDLDLAVARQGDLLARVVDDEVDADVLDRAVALGLDVASPPCRGVATPPMWNVRIVSCVPGSPIDWAAMMPTAMPSSTSWPVDRSMP